MCSMLLVPSLASHVSSGTCSFAFASGNVQFQRLRKGHKPSDRQQRRQGTVLPRASRAQSQQLQTLPAILLAHFASQNRSLLAANCLIEAVVDLYRQGITLDSIQFAMSMACLESGSTLLSQQELDLLTARCGIIMLALQDVGCDLYPGASEHQSPVSEQAQQQTRGLHKFVKQIVQMYGSGFTSRKMLLQQSLAGQDRSKGVSPSVISMQQNTRLAVLTLQMLQDSGMHTASVTTSASQQDTQAEEQQATIDPHGHNPQTHTRHEVLSPTGFILGFVHSTVEAQQAGVPSRSSAEATSVSQVSIQQPSSSTSDVSSDSAAKSAQHASTSQQQPSSDMLQQQDPSSTSQQGSSSSYSSSSQQTAAEASQQQAATSSGISEEQEPASQHTGQTSAALRDQADSQHAQQASATSNKHDPAQHVQHGSADSSKHDPTQHAQQAAAGSSKHDSAQHAQHASELVPEPSRAARSAAVKLLIAFMGALQASQYAVDAFVTSTLQCYRHGWVAQELFDQMQEEEFAQSGGLVPYDPQLQPSRDSPPALIAELFARWLSTVYMTLAQLGVPHPQAARQLGWAWVTTPGAEGSQDAVQAHRLANVIENALKKEQAKGQQDDDSSQTRLSQAAQAIRDSSVLQQMASSVNRGPQEEQYVIVTDETLQRTSTGYNVLMQQLELIALTRTAVLD